MMKLSAAFFIGFLLLAAPISAATQTAFTGPFTEYTTVAKGTASCLLPDSTTFNCTLSIPIQQNAAIMMGPMTSGSPPTGGSGHAPVVTAHNCTVSSGFSNGQVVTQVQSVGGGGCAFTALCNGIACAAGDALTGWAISAQSCASCYSISSLGVLQGGTNSANVATEADTVTVTATNSTGTSPGVVQTITAYADGTPGAPGGSANAAALFSNGAAGGTGNNYPNRPPWNVAGADYRTGYDTTLTLKDPASGGFPACVTDTSSHRITIGANGPCTISGYDFSLEGGWVLHISNGCTSGTVTIKNNNFVIGTNYGPTGIYMLFADGATPCNLDLEANTFDGKGCVYTNLAALISYGGTGTFKVQYNQFLNSPQHDLQVIQPSGSTNSFVSQFNYYRALGFASGAHANPFIFGNSGGSWTTATSAFDTIIIPASTGDQSIVGVCPANSHIAGAGSSGNEYFAPTGATITNALIQNNTLIASPLRGASVAFDTFIVRMDSGTEPSPIIRNNYFDVTGVLTAATPFLLSTATSPAISGNILLTNGHSCNANGSCS